MHPFEKYVRLDSNYLLAEFNLEEFKERLIVNDKIQLYDDLV